MIPTAITHPTAILSREIENLVLKGENTEDIFIKGKCFALSRLVSLTVFPIFLLVETNFIRIPKLLFSIGDLQKFNKNIDKITTLVLSFLFFPIGIYSPEFLPGFFLKNFSKDSTIIPFGVENLYGMAIDHISYPKTITELQNIVRQAKKENRQISVIGAGMSEGTQTVPKDTNQIVVNTKYLNKIELSEDKKTLTAQSGATWENVQISLNKEGKSTIVKQASDPFSVGGSIAINCHGWAHEYGAISSTVEALEIIDADGELQTLTTKDELFGCMFGTLGYFGIIVSASLKVVDNEYLIEKTEEIDLSDFTEYYYTKIKGKNIPLFGGRLTLDTLNGIPLRKVYMVGYEKIQKAGQTTTGVKTPSFLPEPKMGTHTERIFLKLVAHLPNVLVKSFLSWLWEKEKKMMFSEKYLTRNEVLHPPINAFQMLHRSNLYTQWLQEYFVKEENLHSFILFLGAELKENNVRLINATIRPTPKDTISLLPFAERDRYAIVISFSQKKTQKEIESTKRWIGKINQFLIDNGDVFYQAYMPYATREQFEKSYGEERVNLLRAMKRKYDPSHIFGNVHTAKYYNEKVIKE
ncbi:MAG: FAD-binding oxidoreductase [Chlamydiales bacterium]